MPTRPGKNWATRLAEPSRRAMGATLVTVFGRGLTILRCPHQAPGTKHPALFYDGAHDRHAPTHAGRHWRGGARARRVESDRSSRAASTDGRAFDGARQRSSESVS